MWACWNFCVRVFVFERCPWTYIDLTTIVFRWISTASNFTGCNWYRLYLWAFLSLHYPFPVQEVPPWRVKSSGVSQSKRPKSDIDPKGLNMISVQTVPNCTRHIMNMSHLSNCAIINCYRGNNSVGSTYFRDFPKQGTLSSVSSVNFSEHLYNVWL